jgi:predicted negative regulator of RcsB-dependent stress response
LREALTLLEDVLIYRPHDPELNDRAARVCIQLGKFDAAHSYVETLIEGTSDVAAYHTLMGQIHRERNELDAAISAFEMALKIDGEDLEARRALASVRIGERNAAQRGTS